MSTLTKLQALTERKMPVLNPLFHACTCRPGHYLTSALKDDSTLLGVPLLGKYMYMYDAAQLKVEVSQHSVGATWREWQS